MVLLALLLLAAPPSFDALFRAGLDALNRNDLPTAQATLKGATRLRPRDARAHLALAQAYRKASQSGLATRAADRAAGLAGTDPAVLHGLSLFHAESGGFLAAADFEARFAATSAADRDAWLRAASLALQGKNATRAVELARKGLAAESRGELHHLLGLAHEANTETTEAILALQQAIRLRPYEESYYFDFAKVLLTHQNFDTAIVVLETARKTFDRSPQLELALGVAYYGQRRFDDAVTAFLRSATLAPSVPQPYVFLGRILEHATPRLDEVVTRFSAFAQAQPGSALAHFLHGKALLARDGPTPQAESALRRGLVGNDGQWETHFELGSLLERRRQWAEAATAFSRAAELIPRNPEPHYRLARVYDRLNQPEKAAHERALHERLTAEEKAAMERHAAGVRRPTLRIE